MLQSLSLAAVLAIPADAQPANPPPPGDAAQVQELAEQARQRFRRYPDSCAGVFTPERIRDFLLHATAEKKGFIPEAARVQELAVEEAACRAASAVDDGPCLAVGTWEGTPKPGTKSRLAAACRARKAEALFWRAVHIERKGEAQACAVYFSAQDWNPFRADALTAVCVEAVRAQRSHDPADCAPAAVAGWLKPGVKGASEALRASCAGQAQAARTGTTKDCARDDKGRPEAACLRIAAFGAPLYGRGPCAGWDCRKPLTPGSCAPAANELTAEFCRSLAKFEGVRADEALFRAVYQR